jgi:hypothetical protein
MNAMSQSIAAAVAPPTGRLWAGVTVFAAGWVIGLGLVPEVGPWRYRLGLVMILSPCFLGLLLTYIGPVLPGGDKLRALFVRNAKAVFPEKAAAAN